MNTILLIVTFVGIVSGGLNAAAAGGGVISFLALILLGVPPQVANATNLLVMPFSFVSGFGLMSEHRVSGLALVGAGAGTLLGVAATQVVDATVYKSATPWLIYVASGMLLLEPAVTRLWPVVTPRPRWITAAALIGTGVYAGFFGGAVGTLVLVVLAFTTGWPFDRSNLAKIVICLTTSSLGMVGFSLTILLRGPTRVVDGELALWLGLGMLIGGLIGTKLISPRSDPVSVTPARLATLTPTRALKLRWIVVGISITTATALLILG